MTQMIQQILIFVIIVTVLRELIQNESYQQYFRFFSGILLVLLLITPVLNFLSEDEDWYQLLEENFIRQDMNEKIKELEIAEGLFQDSMLEECNSEVERQIMEMAEEEGLKMEEVSVKLSPSGESYEIKKIELQLEREQECLTTGSDQTIEEGEEVNQNELDRATKKLKSRISELFQMQEEKIIVWKS